MIGKKNRFVHKYEIDLWINLINVRWKRKLDMNYFSRLLRLITKPTVLLLLLFILVLDTSESAKSTIILQTKAIWSIYSLHNG